MTDETREVIENERFEFDKGGYRFIVWVRRYVGGVTRRSRWFSWGDVLENITPGEIAMSEDYNDEAYKIISDKELAKRLAIIGGVLAVLCLLCYGIYELVRIAAQYQVVW